MACCGGGDGALIIAGTGVAVEGTGQTGSPYVIALKSGQVQFTVADSDTINMQINGDGSGLSPFVLSAEAAVSMSELTDVDGTSTPTLGDVPLYDGTKWVFGPPPTVPPGSVYTGTGITGDGSIGNPIGVAVSDLVTDAVTGLATYIDTASELRAVPPTWDEVTSKPTSWDAATINGRTLFVQAADPISSAVEGDLWLEEVA